MEAAQARLSLDLSKCHIVGNHMSWLISFDSKTGINTAYNGSAGWFSHKKYAYS